MRVNALRWIFAAMFAAGIGSSIDQPAFSEERPENQSLRERLTEREDENRVEDPWTTEVFGYPLSVAGQYEAAIAAVNELGLGDPDNDYDVVLFAHELELETFYTLGEPLSFFAQVKFEMAEDLVSGLPDSMTERFVERGEMWIHAEDILGSGFSFEIGRLDFEDDRRWWWDEDLDAVRIGYETDSAELVLAVAREMFTERSDRNHVFADQERVVRYLAEFSWDWAEHHGIQLFALFNDDHSKRDPIGKRISEEREDDSDARLTWAGARATGAFETGSHGIFGYWVDTAFVTGREILLEFEEVARHRSVVEAKTYRDVSGWALDVGTTWIAPVAGEPRLTLGYAVGSGERHPDEGDDRSFRQTGIQSDEAGFGGVQSFASYGELLDPELSNLHIWTVGAGISLAEQTTFDVVYHYYRLFEPTTSLRDAELEPDLDGRHRDLGHGIDLVLAIEDFAPFEFEIVGSFFKAGQAFETDRGDWAIQGFARISVAF